MDYSTDFTPISALIGGGLIGIASGLADGGERSHRRDFRHRRIADRPEGGDRLWRLAFIIGLVVAPLAYMATGREIDVAIPASTPLLIIAGLLVGVGTQLGSGCTSGHGVCGISRFSARGIVATITFMVAGAAAVFVIRHVI
jgi:hypothetical protein